MCFWSGRQLLQLLHFRVVSRVSRAILLRFFRGHLQARRNATRRYAFSDPKQCETIRVPTAASDHGKQTFLTFGQDDQRAQSLDPGSCGVFKPGMGEDLENRCKRVGGNSKGRD